MCLQVQYGEEREGIRISAIALHAAPQQRLRQDEIGELGEVE